MMRLTHVGRATERAAAQEAAKASGKPPPSPSKPSATLIGAPLALDGVEAASGLEIIDDGATAYVPNGHNSAFVYQLDLRAGAPGAAGAMLSSAPRVELKPCIKQLQSVAKNDAAALAAAMAAAARGKHSKEEPPWSNIFQDVKHQAAAILPGLGSAIVKRDGGLGAETPDFLVLFGSGSQPGVDDSIAVIEPKTGAAATYNAGSLMAALRADESVTGAGAPLNITAAVGPVGGIWLALFNCGSAPGGRTASSCCRSTTCSRIS
jgi:hypothetical protein